MVFDDGRKWRLSSGVYILIYWRVQSQCLLLENECPCEVGDFLLLAFHRQMWPGRLSFLALISRALGSKGTVIVETEGAQPPCAPKHPCRWWPGALLPR